MEREERNWKGVWISDPDFHVESPLSPTPMAFRHRIRTKRPAASLRVFAAAMGVFDLYLDGRRIHEDFFRPGFTDYGSRLQYTRDEVKNLPAGEHTLTAVTAGGWAVGAHHPHIQYEQVHIKALRGPAGAFVRRDSDIRGRFGGDNRLRPRMGSDGRRSLALRGLLRRRNL